MNRNDSIERVLEQWFTEGPRQMSDRLFDATFERIERLPRRRLADLRLRLPTMNLNVRLAAAAAVLILLGGVGFAVLDRVPEVGSTPSPTSSPTSSPSMAPASASQIQAAWVSTSARRSPGSSIAHPYEIVIDSQTIVLGQESTEMTSVWSMQSPGALEARLLSSMVGYWSCPPGAGGTYDIRISADGTVLTFAPRADACQMQADILTGEWTRIEDGVLAPGLTAGTVFRPFGPGTTGRLWRVNGPGSEDEASLQFVNPFGPSGSWIYVISGIRPGTEPPSASCAPPFSAPQRTPAALVAWIQSFAALEVSPPKAVTIGGLDGVSLDITERVEATKGCGVPFAGGSRIEVLGGGSWVYPITKLRLILLDRGDGESILIDIGTGVGTVGEQTWDSVDAAMSIVNAFEFRR